MWCIVNPIPEPMDADKIVGLNFKEILSKSGVNLNSVMGGSFYTVVV